MLDFLIIGQGLAGSLLGRELHKNGFGIHIISNQNQPSSSAAAGGMFNPVTGKHLAKTWLADELFPFLHQYYNDLEKELNDSFFHPKPIYRPFKNENQKSQFVKAISKHNIEDYCEVCPPSETRSEVINEELGGIQTSNGGWVDVPKMLDCIAIEFDKLGLSTNTSFDYNNLNVHKEHVEYDNLKARKVIFCEGFYVKDNPFFNWLPFNPVKGETLKVKIDGEKIREIVNQNSWVMPLYKDMYRLGATYSWHELDFIPTSKGRGILEEKIKNYLKPPFQIVDHIAGVRPATKDRRPIIGPHPHHPNLFIFNGLGTKGVSLAPYFVFQMIDYLKGKKELHPEITIERFYPLY